jgi:hypothetical protein
MTRSEEYAAWIADYIKRMDGKLLGRCHSGTAEMMGAFPELKVARGHVHCVWGKRGHVWCVDEEGNIVDPTKTQFEAYGIMTYEEWQPGDEVRVGKCMNCGDEIWKALQTLDEEPRRECICGPECEKAFTEWQEAGYP